MPDRSYSINPDRNRPWNELPLLPLPGSLYNTVEVLDQWGKAKASLAKLQGRSAAIPDQELLIDSISLQEAKASSAIENIFTTDDELYKAFSEHENEEGTDDATKEVLRYREALKAGQDEIERKGAFDRDYFLKLYQVIMGMKDGIRPPFARTQIKQGGSGPNAGSVIYTPPRGKGVIEEKLDNLIEFMNDDGVPPSDPLLKMAIAHYQFEAIHPFRDGNGRVGRIFCINYLTYKGFLDEPILFLSRYIIEEKDDYYAYLAGVSQRGDWNSWLRYILKAVEVTAELTYRKVDEIINVKEEIQKVLEKETSLRSPERLVRAIFRQPFTKVKHLTEQGIYAENTARNYLQTLCEMGILEQKIIRGRHYYLNLELYRILSE